MYNRAYLRLKSCPKCGGDISVDRALEDSDVCIQCGFRYYPKVAPYIPVRQRLKKTVAEVDGQTNREVKAQTKSKDKLNQANRLTNNTRCLWKAQSRDSR